jgi:hypothetical protein
MESFLTMAMMIYTLLCYSEGRLKSASAFAALSILARPDTAILLCIIFTHFLLVKRRVPPIAAVMIFIVILLPWFAFSYYYYGAFLPNTYEAKLDQGAAKDMIRGAAFLQHLPEALSIKKPLFLVEVLFWCLGISVIRQRFLNNLAVGILTLWGGAYIFAYAFLLNAPGYPWYYTPLLLSTGTLTSVAIAFLFTSNTPLIRLTGSFIGLFLICIIAYRGTELSTREYSRTSEKYKRYSSIGRWLSAIADTGEALASQEIGVLGFTYSKGAIIDGLGLIHKPIPQDATLPADSNKFIEHFKPAYVLTRKPARNPGENFSKTAHFLSSYTLYQRKLPAPGYQLFYRNSSALARKHNLSSFSKSRQRQGKSLNTLRNQLLDK